MLCLSVLVSWFTSVFYEHLIGAVFLRRTDFPGNKATTRYLLNTKTQKVYGGMFNRVCRVHEGDRTAYYLLYDYNVLFIHNVDIYPG